MNDKIHHFHATAFFTFALSIILTALKLPLNAAAGIAIGAVLLAGILKEEFDSRQRDNIFDRRDLWADFAGAFFGAVLFVCLMIVIKRGAS